MLSCRNWVLKNIDRNIKNDRWEDTTLADAIEHSKKTGSILTPI